MFSKIPLISKAGCCDIIHDIATASKIAVCAALALQCAIILNEKIADCFARIFNVRGELINFETPFGWLIDKTVGLPLQGKFYNLLEKTIVKIGIVNDAIENKFSNRLSRFAISLIFPSIIEEMIFRSGVQKFLHWSTMTLTLKAKCPFPTAMRLAHTVALLASTYIFTMAHTGNITNTDSRQIFKSGIVFGCVYMKYGLIAAIFTHALHNALQGVRNRNVSSIPDL